MLRVDCGSSKDYYAVLDGDYVYFNHRNPVSGISHNIVTMNMRDYAEVFQIFKQMRETYRAGTLKYKANVYIGHTYFKPFRTPQEALETGTVYIHYSCEQNEHYQGAIEIMAECDVSVVHRHNGSGEPNKTFRFSIVGETQLKRTIDEYLMKCEKVKCIIDGQEIYLSKESVEALKSLGK